LWLRLGVGFSAASLEAKAAVCCIWEREKELVACTAEFGARLDAGRRAGPSRRRGVLLGPFALQLHADRVVGGIHGGLHAALGERVAGELDRQPRGGWQQRPGPFACLLNSPCLFSPLPVFIYS
jgi:hypothetical protein